MKTLVLGALGATLLASAASAAPVNAMMIGSSDEVSNIEQVRMVCNEFGRCWRTGPRVVQRYYDDDDAYVERRGYYGGPGYYHHGYGGPGVSFSFGSHSW